MSGITASVPGGFLQIDRSFEISRVGPAQLPELSIGETVEATIARSLGKGRFMVQLKNTLIPAHSDLLFKEGDRISVAVERLFPDVLLRIAGRSISGNRGVTDFFPGNRLGAPSLLSFFTEASAFLKQAAASAPGPGPDARTLENILTLIRSLVLSKETLRDPLFVKNYILHLGLLHEKLLHRGKGGKGDGLAGDRSRGSLKSLLLEMAGRREVPDGGPIKETDVMKTGRNPVRQIIDSGLTAIETEQWLNLFFQETEGRYLLSLPFLLDSRILMQHIMIRPEEDKEGRAGKERSYKMTLYLDLDVLGRAVADVVLKGNRIGCALRWEDKKGCNLLAPCLDDLAERLKTAGYGLDYLSCTLDPTAGKDREAFEQELFLHTCDDVDCFA